MDVSGNGTKRVRELEQELEETRAALDKASLTAMEWETTFNASRDAIWLLDKDQTVVRSNTAAEGFFLMPCHAFIGRKCWEIVHKTDKPIPECLILRARKSLKRETMELPAGDRHLLVSVDPILDRDGEFNGAVHVISDVTAIREIAGALKASEETYRDLVENSPILICTHDLEGRILSAGTKACELLGFDPATLLKMNIKDILAPEGEGFFPAYIEELRSKGTARGEMVVSDARGRRRIWEYNNSLRTAGVETPLVRGIAIDVTEKKEAQRSVRKRLKYEKLLSKISSMAVNEADLAPFIAASLAMVGETTGVSRTYLFEHRYATDSMDNTFEWCNQGIIPQKDTLQGIPSQSVRWWMETMEKKGRVCLSDIEDIPDEGLKEILRSQGTLSVLAVPLSVARRYYGFLGLEDCKARRIWPEEDIELLVAVSSLISGVMERNEKERLLRESEERFKRIYEESPVAYQSLDWEGMLIDVNPAWLKLLGYRREEVIGYPMEEFLPPECRAGFTEGFSAYRRTGTINGSEMRVLYKDGRVLTIIFDGVFVKDEKGDPSHTHCVLHDITDRKLAEEALKRSEEEFHQLFEAESDAIFLIDNLGGSILKANQAACAMYGYRREELLSMKNSDLSAEPEMTKKVTRETPPIEDRVITIPLRWHKKKDGERFPVEITGRFFVRDGRSVHVAAIRDITARISAEKEREKLQDQLSHAQKLESVGRLAGGVAHDFNNMLGVIIGHADLILDELAPESTVSSDIKEILKAAERSADLTRQLLAFARRQTAVPRILDLNDTISDTLKMLRRLIGEDTELTWIPGPGLGRVRIDPSQIDQILANLCVNARDAMGGSGRISIETRNISVDASYCAVNAEAAVGDYVLMALGDDGCGMDKETISHIFEPFFTTKGVGEGTGLGLATVYGIVKQNNGFINVYSEPGQGTIFNIYLPRVEKIARQTSEPEPAEKLDGAETVLLVEDEESILLLGKKALERHGYKVIEARNPRQALEVARSHEGPIDLLVTDVIMPEMNGKELKESVEALRPGIKALYMSGYTTNVIMRRGILDENVNFLQKPFSVKGLASKVREVLDKNDE